MSLKMIRLELARTKEFPEGSAQHGYEFVAPLDGKGRLDGKAWKQFKQACTVHRFWNGDDEHGVLVHRPDGKWVFSYEPGDDADDEPIFRLDRHAFAQGEYVSVTEHDGVTRPFRVAALETPVSLRKK